MQFFCQNVMKTHNLWEISKHKHFTFTKCWKSRPQSMSMLFSPIWMDGLRPATSAPIPPSSTVQCCMVCIFFLHFLCKKLRNFPLGGKRALSGIIGPGVETPFKPLSSRQNRHFLAAGEMLDVLYGFLSLLCLLVENIAALRTLAMMSCCLCSQHSYSSPVRTPPTW